jgi:propionyl-CoA synthetase
MIRQQIGAFACFKDSEVYSVHKLPKTRSGKILRNSLRNIVNGEKVKVPPTIEDVSAIDDILKLFG